MIHKHIFFLLFVVYLSSSLLATQTKKKVSFRLATVDILEENVIQYGISYGFMHFFDNHFSFGINFNWDYANSENENYIFGYGSTASIGYGFLNNEFNIYLIGGALIQSMKDSGYGFGYGSGIEYNINSSWGLGLEYQNYTMQTESGSYDYSQSSLMLQYKF